jgi:excisionase family DNA binding protein
VNAEGIMPDSNSELLIPVREGFRRLGIGPTKGYELIAEGHIETVHIGTRRMIKAESLRAFAERGTGEIEAA